VRGRSAQGRRGNRMRRRTAMELWRAATALAATQLATPRRAAILVTLAAACFTVAPAMRYFLDHPYFAVRRVEVEGTARVDPARVRTWLGMVVGRSMWRVSPRDVEAQLEERPEVADARVRRIFPGRLLVTIREREPRALLNAPDGGIFLVDEAGVVIGRAGEDVGDLPIISLTEGDRVPAERHLAEAVRVANLLEGGHAGVPISELAIRYVDGEPELVGYSDGGRLTLQLGWGAWNEKLAALSRVVAHESSRGDKPRRVASLVGVVDVRDPRAVAARWAASGSA
jgi:cell division septal protein FtsQ